MTISIKARLLIKVYVDACIQLDRAVQAQPDVFKSSKPKWRASEKCEQAREALWSYIAELEAKAGVE